MFHVDGEEETLSVQLAALRLQLEEKRRKFHKEKEKKEERWREVRNSKEIGLNYERKYHSVNFSSPILGYLEKNDRKYFSVLNLVKTDFCHFWL